MPNWPSDSNKRIDSYDRCIGSRNNRDSQVVPHQQHFLNHEQMFYTMAYMYCLLVLCKALVTIHGMHLTANDICLDTRDAFNGSVAIFNAYKWRHSDVIVIKLTDDTQN